MVNPAGCWELAKAYALSAPGQPVFGDLIRWNGVDPPSPGFLLRRAFHLCRGHGGQDGGQDGAARMKARAGGAVHRLALEWSGMLDFQEGAAIIGPNDGVADLAVPLRGSERN